MKKVYVFEGRVCIRGGSGMKTRELRDYLRNSHHSFREDEKYIRVYGDGFCLCKVGLEKLYDVKIFEPDLISEGLYRRLTGYAQTLPEDREEEKRYRVKFPGITRDGKNIYLMRQSNRDGTHGIDWSPEEYIFDDFPDGYLFTEKEIKSINEHYWHFAEEWEAE